MPIITKQCKPSDESPFFKKQCFCSEKAAVVNLSLLSAPKFFHRSFYMGFIMKKKLKKEKSDGLCCWVTRFSGLSMSNKVIIIIGDFVRCVLFDV